MRAGAEVLVLGAGPAGIGAGLALGDRALVVDAASEAGGLARTVDLDGALMDLGGHSFHTPHPAVRELVFGALPMEERARDAWCLVGGDFIPYPFQRHFGLLKDPALVAACREGLAGGRAGADAHDFDAWLDFRFGHGIADAFLKPYNRKLWGDDLARLSPSWTAERVAAPLGVAERFEHDGGKRKPLHDDTCVAYPAEGGYGAIFAVLAQRLPRLRLGAEVVAIDPRARTATFRDGAVLHFRELVSTLPLPRLLDCVVGAPAALRDAVARLESLPVTLAMVAVEGPPSTTRQRVYVADDALPGHKVVVNGNSSRWLASRPRHGVQVEVSGPSLARVGAHALMERVVAGLLRHGLVDDERRIVATRMVTLPLGYPVPTHACAGIVAQAKAWLASHGLHTLGRFGEWAYVNADEALHRGLMWPSGALAAAGD